MSAAAALSRFQDAFARALFDESGAGALASLTAQPGFAVYRNTVMKGGIDALQANYPSVHRLVGDDWFCAAAAVYVRAHLPRVPTLLEYGEDFAAFLAGFEPAAALPYLPGVAKLDRCWTEAHIAPDEEPLAPACVARLGALELGACRLRPHASARWAFFEDAPVATLWRSNRHDGGAAMTTMRWRGEGLLLVRPQACVEAVDLDGAGCAFMTACADGVVLADAAARSLEIDPDTDFSALMARLLGAGAFTGITA